MCIPLTPVLCLLYTVITQIYTKSFIDSVSLRDIGKSTSRAEISSPSSSYLKAVKGALSGSPLILLLGILITIENMEKRKCKRLVDPWQ